MLCVGQSVKEQGQRPCRPRGPGDLPTSVYYILLWPERTLSPEYLAGSVPNSHPSPGPPAPRSGVTSAISLSRALRSRAHSASLFSHISWASSLGTQGSGSSSSPRRTADGQAGLRSLTQTSPDALNRLRLSPGVSWGDLNRHLCLRHSDDCTRAASTLSRMKLQVPELWPPWRLGHRAHKCSGNAACYPFQSPGFTCRIQTHVYSPSRRAPPPAKNHFL